uniref:Doublecortin domain-containing protein n=1 Tax=Megaselia scalaris TaxID=36166 RepID=T1GHL1_MEGSC
MSNENDPVDTTNNPTEAATASAQPDAQNNMNNTNSAVIAASAILAPDNSGSKDDNSMNTMNMNSNMSVVNMNMGMNNHQMNHSDEAEVDDEDDMDDDVDYVENNALRRRNTTTGPGGGGACGSAGGRGGAGNIATAPQTTTNDYWNRNGQLVHSRASRPELNVVGGMGAVSRYSNLSYWKARRVVFYRNGDPFFPGVELRYRPGRDITSIDNLLDKISSKLDLPRGARYVFSMDGD